jgi:hypothetical protein
MTSGKHRVQLSQLRIGPLELALIAAVVGLCLQLFPAMRPTLSSFDFRNWSSRTWRFGSLILCSLLVSQYRKLAASGRGTKRLAIIGLVLLFLVFLYSWVVQVGRAALPDIVQLVNPMNWTTLAWIVLFVLVLSVATISHAFPNLIATTKKQRAAAAAKKLHQKEMEERRQRRLRSEELQRRQQRGIDFY